MNDRNKSRRASERAPERPTGTAESDVSVSTTSGRNIAVQEELDFLWKTGSHLNDQIRFADSKAGFTVALSTATIGGFFGSGAHKVLTQSPPAVWRITGWLTGSAFVLLGGSILLGIWTVHPRFAARQQSQITFWEEILRYGSGREFHEKLRQQSPDEVLRIVSQHVFALAEICRAKYAFLSGCMAAGAAGGMAAALVMLWKR
jgi:hypothetical protein